MMKRNMSNKRLLFIDHLSLPFRSIQPGKLAVHPDAGTRNITCSMEFLAYMRPVNVAQIITFVKIQEQAPIPNRQVSWHNPALLSNSSSSMLRLIIAYLQYSPMTMFDCN